MQGAPLLSAYAEGRLSQYRSLWRSSSKSREIVLPLRCSYIYKSLIEKDYV